MFFYFENCNNNKENKCKHCHRVRLFTSIFSRKLGSGFLDHVMGQYIPRAFVMLSEGLVFFCHIQIMWDSTGQNRHLWRYLM